MRRRSSKDKSNDRSTPLRAVMQATMAVLSQIWNQDAASLPLWARRVITSSTVKRSRECPDQQSKTGPTIPINIDLFVELQRSAEMENGGYGRYPQEPVRIRYVHNVRNVDHQVHRARNDVEDARFQERNRHTPIARTTAPDGCAPNQAKKGPMKGSYR